jgi:hypothetical protein
MKTFVVLGLVLAMPALVLAQSPLPKEGSGALTSYFTGTLKVLPAGQDFAAITYESFGIVTNDAGQGFLHNASAHCVGGLTT